MTMHLARGFSTISTRKPKTKKLTRAQQETFAEEHRAYNKRMKQQGRHSERMTFDEYVNCRFGYVQKSVAKDEFVPLKSVRAYHRETKHVPSLDTGAGCAPKPERKEYTGTLIKGIATMHKSNAVPVIDPEHAKDIAHMRR